MRPYGNNNFKTLFLVHSIVKVLPYLPSRVPIQVIVSFLTFHYNICVDSVKLSTRSWQGPHTSYFEFPHFSLQHLCLFNISFLVFVNMGRYGSKNVKIFYNWEYFLAILRASVGGSHNSWLRILKI